MTLASEILARRMRLPRAQTHDIVRETNLAVAMDDGEVLLADRWVAAASRDRPQPTVLVRSPYGRGHVVGMLYGRLLAERGLQTVVQSVRGTFGSGGEFSPFDERADGLATLRWIRAQPWSAGPVATFGASYLGLVQWAMATAPESELAALAVQVSASQFHDQTFPGGSLSLQTVASWMVIIATQERRLGGVATGRGLRGLPDQLARLPLADLDERATGRAVGWFREGFGETGRESAYWSARDFSPAVAEVSAPVSFVGGWYDIFLPWMLADFERLQDAGRAPRLLIGPWSHTSPGLTAAAEREGLAWLRRHLLGDGRSAVSGPVRVVVTGEGGGWRDLSRWPPSGTGERRLYVAGDGRLSDRAPARAGEAGAGATSASQGYRYDPRDPTPSLGGPVLLDRNPVVDNAALEARADVLVFTGPSLTVAAEAIGHVGVEIHARTSRPWFDLFARVCDVDRAGVSRNVCDALVSVAPGRFGQDADGAWRVTWSLWPLAHRFAAGHRIRLLVGSGAHPRYARNPGTGADPLRAGVDEMRAVDVEILHGAEHPSALVLPASG
ncbi:MAG: CocE/NonD family hydrolase [Solirubrobacterales bacterium]|nr:CocE/NonD family hydrolase [Solirubrobacterales bacterium]